MVRKQGGILVPAGAHPLDPLRERGMQLCTPRLRKTLIRNLARQRVLERVLGFALEGRARPSAHEVAILEHAEVGLLSFEELVHGAGPEDAADYRRRLQRSFLRRLEQVDARREDRLDRVRHGKARR